MDIAKWDNTADARLHCFYPTLTAGSTRQLQVALNEMTELKTVVTIINNKLKIALNANGIYINGTKIDTLSQSQNFNTFITQKTAKIGSVQGRVRSQATYNEVGIYNRLLSSEELIALTRARALSVTGVTISGKTEVKIGSSITSTANLTPSIADIKTGSWSASNTNVTLNDSNSLSVVVNGSVLGSSTITFTSDDTTNGTISATYDVNVVEASSGGSGGETQPYEAELILQPEMIGGNWKLHSASTSSDCTGFECQPSFKYFDFPEDTSSTDTSYMYCSESIPVVTDSNKKVNNIPCVAGASAVDGSIRREYITLKLSNSDASTIDELKTYLTNNIISLKVNMRPEVSKYTFNTDNITMISANKSKEGYVIGEFIDDSCPVTSEGSNKALLLAGLPSIQDWSLNIGFSYFKIVDWNNHRYIGFQIAENLLETHDLDGIKNFISKNPTVFYVV